MKHDDEEAHTVAITDTSEKRIITVVTTLDNRDLLERIGRHLLEARLIACMQIVGPIKSTYWWKGRIEEAEEWIGLMKTGVERWGKVEEEIGRLHPYETPQILSLEIARVLPAYREWVLRETGGE
jgi:periplasmic divalent cation tolerance protein